jgi:hypothetical protein
MALHRHWMWGNVIKKHFASEVADTTTRGISNNEQLLFDKYGAYMSIWYGMLYGTLEGLKKNGVLIPEIQSEIDSIYESLRLYRNAVFHPQAKYFSHKLFKIMEDSESPKKIWKVHAGLGKFFLEEFERLNSGKPGKYVHE